MILKSTKVDMLLHDIKNIFKNTIDENVAKPQEIRVRCTGLEMFRIHCTGMGIEVDSKKI